MADEKLLSKIRGLLDKANSTEFPAERDQLLAKAEQWMQQHEIDQAELDATRPGMQRSVISRDIIVPKGEFASEMASLLCGFADHRSVRTTVTSRGRDRVRVLMGFEDDVALVELLYTTTMLDFASKLTPTWDPRSSTVRSVFDRNVRNFKEAGFKWVEIARLANKNGGNPATGLEGSTTDGSWLKAAYRRECVRLGIAPTRQTQRHAAFRATFASGYVAMVSVRLAKMRHDAEQASGVISGNLPAVRDSKARVDEKFYEAFPNLRPMSAEEMKRRSDEWKAQTEQDQREREEFLASLSESERRRFLLQEERRAEKQEREWARQDRARYDESGYEAGQRAASTVDLSGGERHLVGKKEIE